MRVKSKPKVDVVEASVAGDDGKALPLVGRPGRESKEQGVTAPNQGPGRVALAKTFPIANCPGFCCQKRE